MFSTNIELPDSSGVINALNAVLDWGVRYANYRNYLVDQWGDPADCFTNPRNIFDDLNSKDKEWFKVTVNQFVSIGIL